MLFRKTKRLNKEESVGAPYKNYMVRLHSLRALLSSSMTKYHDQNIMFAFKVIHNLLPFEPGDFDFKLSHWMEGPLFTHENIFLERARNLTRFLIP